MVDRELKKIRCGALRPGEVAALLATLENRPAGISAETRLFLYELLIIDAVAHREGRGYVGFHCNPKKFSYRNLTIAALGLEAERIKNLLVKTFTKGKRPGVSALCDFQIGDSLFMFHQNGGPEAEGVFYHYDGGDTLLKVELKLTSQIPPPQPTELLLKSEKKEVSFSVLSLEEELLCNSGLVASLPPELMEETVAVEPDFFNPFSFHPATPLAEFPCWELLMTEGTEAEISLLAQSDDTSAVELTEQDSLVLQHPAFELLRQIEQFMQEGQGEKPGLLDQVGVLLVNLQEIFMDLRDGKPLPIGEPQETSVATENATGKGKPLPQPSPRRSKIHQAPASRFQKPLNDEFSSQRGEHMSRGSSSITDVAKPQHPVLDGGKHQPVLKKGGFSRSYSSSDGEISYSSLDGLIHSCEKKIEEKLMQIDTSSITDSSRSVVLQIVRHLFDSRFNGTKSVRYGEVVSVIGEAAKKIEALTGKLYMPKMSERERYILFVDTLQGYGIETTHVENLAEAQTEAIALRTLINAIK